MGHLDYTNFARRHPSHPSFRGRIVSDIPTSWIHSTINLALLQG